MTTATDKDRRILEAYLTQKGSTFPKLAKQFGVRDHDIRAALERCRRAGLEVKKGKPETVQVAVTKTTAAREAAHVSITLPRLRIMAIDDHLPIQRKVTTPVPELSAHEEFMMRRLALIKQVHKDGQRRGLFQVRSR